MENLSISVLMPVIISFLISVILYYYELYRKSFLVPAQIRQQIAKQR